MTSNEKDIVNNILKRKLKAITTKKKTINIHPNDKKRYQQNIFKLMRLLRIEPKNIRERDKFILQLTDIRNLNLDVIRIKRFLSKSNVNYDTQISNRIDILTNMNFILEKN